MIQDDLVLVVEDQQDTRELLVMLLELDGYRVVAAADGIEALEILERGTTPCVVLMDLMMPRMDGWELLKRLQGAWPSSCPPVVLVSGVPDLPERARDLRVSFVQKPVDADRLLDEVRRCCRR